MKSILIGRDEVFFMDVLARIKQLMDEREWTIYRLSKESGVQQSTLSNLWRRNNVPSIFTLEEICGGFGITLAEFFAESPGELAELTAGQRELLGHWDKLTPEQKNALLTLLRAL